MIDNKIKLFSREYEKDTIQFCHPSYWKGFEYSIFDNNSLTQTGEILIQVIQYLADYKESAGAVADIVIANYNKLSKDVTTPILTKLIKNNFAISRLADSIAIHYKILPTNIQKLLFEWVNEEKRADYNYIVEDVLDAVRFGFDYLPEDIRIELLEKMINRNYRSPSLGMQITTNLSFTIANIFDKLPREVRNDFVRKLYNSQFQDGSIAAVIIRYYDNLPDDIKKLLFDLAKREHVSSELVNTLARNYNHLPDNVRKLLFNLADKKSSYVGHALIENYNNLPEEDREKLLKKVLSNPDQIGYIADDIARNYNHLPDNVRKLLFDFLEREDVRDSLWFINTQNYPENLLNELLRRLFDIPSQRKTVASEILSHYNKLPDDIRKLIFDLVDDESVAEDVVSSLNIFFDNVPVNIRNELLIRLLKHNYRIVQKVEEIINKHSKEIPVDISKKFSKRLKNEGIHIFVVSKITNILCMLKSYSLKPLDSTKVEKFFLKLDPLLVEIERMYMKYMYWKYKKTKEIGFCHTIV